MTAPTSDGLRHDARAGGQQLRRRGPRRLALRLQRARRPHAPVQRRDDLQALPPAQPQGPHHLGRPADEQGRPGRGPGHRRQVPSIASAGWRRRTSPARSTTCTRSPTSPASTPRPRPGPTSPPLPQPRSTHDAVVIGRTIYAVGGWTMKGATEEAASVEDAVAFDLDKPEAGWKTIEQPFRRRALSVGRGRRASCTSWAGSTTTFKVERRVDVYDPATGTWSPRPRAPRRQARTDGFGTSAFGVDGAPLLQRRAPAGSSGSTPRGDAGKPSAPGRCRGSPTASCPAPTIPCSRSAATPRGSRPPSSRPSSCRPPARSRSPAAASDYPPTRSRPRHRAAANRSPRVAKFSPSASTGLAPTCESDRDCIRISGIENRMERRVQPRPRRGPPGRASPGGPAHFLNPRVSTR